MSASLSHNNSFTSIASAMNPSIPLLALDANPMLRVFPNQPKAHTTRNATRRNKKRKKKHTKAAPARRSSKPYQFPLSSRKAKPRHVPRPPTQLARLSVPRTIELDDEDNTLCNAMVSAWVAEYAAAGGAADAAFV